MTFDDPNASARALRRRRRSERQAVVFGVLISALAVFALAGAATYAGLLHLPGSGDFVAKAQTDPKFDEPQPCLPPSTLPVARKQIKITVANATGHSGLASSVADALKAREFDVTGTANADQTPQTVIEVGAAGLAHAYTLLPHIPDARLVLHARKDKTLSLIVGQSFQNLTPAEQVVMDPETPIESVTDCAPIEDIEPVPLPSSTKKPARPAKPAAPAKDSK